MRMLAIAVVSRTPYLPFHFKMFPLQHLSVLLQLGIIGGKKKFSSPKNVQAIKLLLLRPALSVFIPDM